MSKIQAVSVECDNGGRSLTEWRDALMTHVSKTPLSEPVRCVSFGQQRFAGRIEFATLDNAVLSRVATMPYILTRSRPGHNPGAPLLLMALLSGTGQVEQRNRLCQLHAGEWCLFDPLQPFAVSALETGTEYVALTLERPTDPERLGLLEQGAARCFDAKTGISRIMLATLTEGFNQLNRLGTSSSKILECALTDMIWDALREHLEAQPARVHQDVVCDHIKSYVERNVADSELSVDAIAHALSMSTRSLHRAFLADPVGSITHYVWMRRLSHCAACLRDPTQANRSIADICFSFGFKSTSHFSRLFKEQFGTTPHEYKTASEDSSLADRSSHSRPPRVSGRIEPSTMSEA